MQLIEYFLWTNNKCNMRNITLSHIGAIVIMFIQPIILYLAILYYNKELYIKNKINIRYYFNYICYIIDYILYKFISDRMY